MSPQMKVSVKPAGPLRNDSVASAMSGMTLADQDTSMDLTSTIIESLSQKPKEIDDDLVKVPSSHIFETCDDSKTVCIIGVGYVGETLLQEFSLHYPVIGFDISPTRIATLNEKYGGSANIQLTHDASMLSNGSHFLISVPTLVNPDSTINTNHLMSAISIVTSHARPGSTIVIESTVSVGMTRALLSPYLDQYSCGMSPERVDPGRTIPAAHTIPKVISGLTTSSLASIQELYGRVFQQLVPVSNPETAEMTKLYENCFRMINIAYVNEIADACETHGINVQEVVDSASTKPFGFMPFRPGLGVGGHCIPINPHYLKLNCNLPVLEKSTKRMAARPQRLAKAFHKQAKITTKARGYPRTPRVLVVGLAFKPGQSLLEGSPALGFAKALLQQGCQVSYYDPLVEQKAVPKGLKKVGSKDWNPATVAKNYDAVALCMKQNGVDLDVLSSIKGAYVKSYC